LLALLRQRISGQCQYESRSRTGPPAAFFRSTPPQWGGDAFY